MLFTKMTDVSLSSSDVGAEQAHGATSPPFHLLPQPVAGQACSPPSRRATAPVNHIPGPGMQKELVPHRRNCSRQNISRELLAPRQSCPRQAG